MSIVRIVLPPNKNAYNNWEFYDDIHNESNITIYLMFHHQSEVWHTSVNHYLESYMLSSPCFVRSYDTL